jgi:hypothetical protein
MKEEAVRYLFWQNTMVDGISDSDAKTSCKVEELKLADYVVVLSFFCKKLLPKWFNKDKAIVSLFGNPKQSIKI